MTSAVKLFQTELDTPNLYFEIMIGDAFKNIRKIKTGSIDFINTDPPFDVSSGSRITKRKQKIIQGKIFDWEIANYDEYMEKLFLEFWRILKPTGNLVLFYSWHKLGHFKNALEKIGFIAKNIINIVKKNPPPHIMRNNLRSSCELGFWFCKDKEIYKFNFLSQSLMRNCFVYEQTVGHKESTHPAEKPVWIYENIIKMFTNEGDLVYDGFLGSGTTLIASIKTGRSCICSEISGEYVKLAKRRTRFYFNTKPLFGEKRPKLIISGNLELLKQKKVVQEEKLKTHKNQRMLLQFT